MNEAEGPTGYRTPPAPIPAAAVAAPPPALTLSPDRSRFALLRRAGPPGIADLARPELRLAGIRIDPTSAGPANPGYFTGITLGDLDGGDRREVPLPEGTRFTDPRWSPDGTHMALVRHGAEGLELWLVDVAVAVAAPLATGLNATLGPSYQWAPDSGSLLLKLVPRDRPAEPLRPSVPAGPVIQESTGSAAPSRTYQDLLASPHDELLFDHHFTAQLARLTLETGALRPIGEPAILTEFAPSPDGRYLLIERLKRPYSYLVPYHRFPSEVEVRRADGSPVRQIADLPLAEEVPIAFDAVPTGPRGLHWRSDAPATLVWAEALDGGDPRTAAEHRDRVFALAAPFDAEPVPLITLKHRYAGVQWGRDDCAIVYSRWWVDRNERRYLVRPGDPGAEPRLLLDRSYQDRYADPGFPVTVRNAAGRFVLLTTPDGEGLYLSGDGASARGDYPFLDRWDLATSEAQRLWQAEDPFYEEVAAILDPWADRVLTRRESAAEPPNYWVRDLRTGAATRLTDFADPAPELAGIGREIVRYQREDGVQLSATLFTPPGYSPERDGPLPLLVWAYPKEFRDADTAGQVDDSPNRFSRPAGASHLFLLTQGYAILDGPAMPIVGVGEVEPNDSYVEQLVASARAAVDHVAALGVADPDRVGIGGHSYGAFMAANLLAHSELFRAGIARSGAYNRTLTPFGFQQEQRSYWEAPEVYHRMSPFRYADRLRRPLLLIHGEVDNNSGTFPMQTERFFQALKGHGAITRYVLLPHESHGYRARESILHVLAEMIEWMDRWVKG